MSKEYRRFLKLMRKHRTIRRKLERETKKLNRAMHDVFNV